MNFQNKLPDNVPTLIQRKFIKKIKNKTRDEQQNKEKRKINKQIYKITLLNCFFVVGLFHSHQNG